MRVRTRREREHRQVDGLQGRSAQHVERHINKQQQQQQQQRKQRQQRQQ